MSVAVCCACGVTLTAYEAQDLAKDVGETLCTDCVRSSERRRRETGRKRRAVYRQEQRVDVSRPNPSAEGYDPRKPDDKGTMAQEALRTRGVELERVRPFRWLWAQRVPIGMLSLIVGEEGIGKGTLAAWMIAQATRGELEGDLRGEPARVLIVGDEDAFDQVWIPRLHAAGADLTMLLTLDDGEFIDDFASAAVQLVTTIESERIGLVLLDALIDHIPGGQAGEAVYNPKNVRMALQPLRRVAAATDIAALGLVHPVKGNPTTFRQLMAGSHQFNAVSRSSLWLARDPEDDKRRVLVRGKGNHSAEPRSVEFAIAADVVELNGHTFEVPKVVDVVEGDRTANDLLKAGPPVAPVRDALAEQLAALLDDEPKKLAALATAVDRGPKDGSVRNALNRLQEQQRAKRVQNGWVRA